MKRSLLLSKIDSTKPRVYVWGILTLFACSHLFGLPLHAQRDLGAEADARETLREQATAPRCCVCNRRGGVGSTARFCATITGGPSCERFQEGPEFAALAEHAKGPMREYTCEQRYNDCALQTSPSDTQHICPTAPYASLQGAANILFPTPTNNTSTPISNREFQSITPELGVAIPGLVFSPATLQNGLVQVPFLAQYISGIQRYLTGLAVTTAVVMIVYGGFLYLLGSSVGDISQGKTIITDALLGMFLVFSAYMILTVVNPNTTKLEPLQLLYVQQQVLGAGADELAMENTPGGPLATSATANNGDPLPGTNPGPPPESRSLCSQPGFAITNFSDFRGTIPANIRNTLSQILNNPQRLARYQAAGRAQNVPWQVLLAIHMNEGSARENGSILNGGELCNANNSSCPAICRNESLGDLQTRDLMCGASVLHRGVGNFTINDMQKIKRALNNYIGYGSSLACDEASQIGAGWDDAHNGIVEQPHDCVPVNCRGGCITDYTTEEYFNTGRVVNPGCCTITVWGEGTNGSQQHRGRQQCNLNHGPRDGQGRCEVARNGDRRTFQYNRGENNTALDRNDPARNPCGTWRTRRRTGHLAMIAWILQQSGGR